MAFLQLYYANIAANAVIDMMIDSVTGAANARFIRRNSRAIMAIEADAAAQCEYRVFTQNRTIVDRSTLDGGGTDGVMPNLDQKAFTFALAAGEILSVEVREIAGAATTDIAMTLSIEPG